MRIALASLISSQNAAENVRLLLHSWESLEDSAELIVFGRQFLQNSDQTGLPENSPLFDANQTGSLLDEYTAAQNQVIVFDYLIDRGSLLHIEEQIDRIIGDKAR